MLCYHDHILCDNPSSLFVLTTRSIAMLFDIIDKTLIGHNQKMHINMYIFVVLTPNTKEILHF